jgi:hypothetical protein
MTILNNNVAEKPELQTLCLLQGWVDIGAMGIFTIFVFFFGWTYIAKHLFIKPYFFIYIQLRLQADEQ